MSRDVRRNNILRFSVAGIGIEFLTIKSTWQLSHKVYYNFIVCCFVATITSNQNWNTLVVIVVFNDEIGKTFPLKVQRTTVRAFVSGKGLPLWSKHLWLLSYWWESHHLLLLGLSLILWITICYRMFCTGVFYWRKNHNIFPQYYCLLFALDHYRFQIIILYSYHTHLAVSQSFIFNGRIFILSTDATVYLEHWRLLLCFIINTLPLKHRVFGQTHILKIWLFPFKADTRVH